MSSDVRFARVLALALFAAVGCADFSRGPAPPMSEPTADAGATGDGGKVSFATDVYPLLSICMNCHVSGGAAATTSLVFTGTAAADYTTVLHFVSTSAGAASRLLSKASGNSHGGGTVYAVGAPEYELILTWIQQGAPP